LAKVVETLLESGASYVVIDMRFETSLEEEVLQMGIDLEGKFESKLIALALKHPDRIALAWPSSGERSPFFGVLEDQFFDARLVNELPLGDECVQFDFRSPTADANSTLRPESGKVLLGEIAPMVAASQAVSARAVELGEVNKDLINGKVVVIGETYDGNPDTISSSTLGSIAGSRILVAGQNYLHLNKPLVLIATPLRIGLVTLLSMGVLWTACRFAARLLAALTLSLVVAAFLGTCAFVTWHSLPVGEYASVSIVASFIFFALWSQGLQDRATALEDIIHTQTSIQYFEPLLPTGFNYSSEPFETEAAILFLDIRDFTKKSEETQGSLLVSELNQLFRRLDAIIVTHGGSTMGYLGDGFYAAFIGLSDNGDFRQRAVNAAEDCIRRVSAFNLQRKGGVGWPWKVGIGVHSGPVYISLVGSESRNHLAVMGDVVNTAARLQDLTKQLGSNLVVSSNIHGSLDRHPTKLLYTNFYVTVRNKKERLSIWVYLPSDNDDIDPA